MLRGVAMGMADLVPGVSGGTVALLLGIYRRLIEALSALSGGTAWRALAAGRWRDAWRAIDGGFLAAVASGIAISVVTLPRLLHWLLEHYPESVAAVFFGLVAASALVVIRRIRGPKRIAVTFAVVGAASAFVLVGLVPAHTPATPVMLIAAGALAVSALLLPGISGAFILVLLGQYQRVLEALAGFEFAVLLPLAAGMLVGLVGFSRLLAWMLRRWPTAVLGLLTGFLVGSLRKVWPWQRLEELHTVATAPPSLIGAATALLLASAAVAVVLLLERLARVKPVPGSDTDGG